MSAIRILPRTLFFGCILLSCVGFATGDALAQFPCSQSDPAVCDGGCPAGEQCFPDVNGGPCRCLPTTIPCEQSPFPECGGTCPSADLACAVPPGAANCECLPAVQACEQGPFPECGGECPSALACQANANLNECVCEPIVAPCDQSPFPVCDGECPPDQVCEPSALAAVCNCVPIVVPCEQGPFPECGGECPTATHCEATGTTVNLPTPDLPPEPNPPDCDRVVSMYEGQDVHALFPNGIDFSNPIHKCFQNVETTTQGLDELEYFDSVVEGVFDDGSGPTPIQLVGPVVVKVSGKAGQSTGSWDTEMVSMSLTGEVGGIPVEIRESPNKPSAGQTTVTDNGDGTFFVDSFFDVFTEISVDGGPFEPQVNPPGRLTLVPATPGTPDTCECVPDVVPCEQGPFPECGGECPTDQVCEPIAGANACGCVPIVIPCEQSLYPECGGECPADRVCEPDASGLDTCGCVPIGQECSQCGPGPHFIDQCGPFPPVGSDLVANNGAVVGIDVDLDCVRDVNLVLHPCPAPDQLLHVEKTLGPIDDSANFPGTSPVDGHPTGPGLDVIDTEIVSLCLTNGAITLAAGVGGPSVLPLQPSLGAVAEDLTSPDPSVADSFFDVFFEVSGIAGGPVYNQSPLQVHSRIDCLPPAASYRHPVGICIPLTTRGTCSAGPNANAPCVSDLDCPDGACAGTLTLANLVSANHSVNQPVCDLSPFPECGGDCPPDQECRPSTDGTDACHCEPIPPVQCEQGPFPECGGECPPDQVCTANPNLNECVCEPIVVACEQSPFPVCDGECPPDQVCEPIAGTTVCRCVPVIVPCEQGPFPECGGECPTDQVCTADTALNACVCEPIVVPCAQSPHPECGGECPADQVCEPDASGLAECACVPIGQECSQCGPGPHFVDQCGPFPPVGTDLVANNSALVGIDVDMDCVRDVNLVLRPCPAPDQLLHVEKTLGPIDDSVNFPGTSPVDGHPTGPGLDVIDTEIVSLCLTNGAITLAAGVGGPSVLPLQPSLGAVAEDLTSPDPAFADSFFDVFFEVSGIAGGPVYNQVPLQVQSRIDCLPPATGYRHPVGICIPLTTRGTCSAGPNANAPCVSDLDCPDGACDGTLTLANLVSALHTVNVPVCDNSPFPECGGECPPDEECRPSTDGTDACRCEPIPPVQCEQGPFPECGGECPPDQVCSANPNLNECVCEPIVVACEQSPFPVCDGECPPDQVCEPIAGTTVCRCVPVVVPCEQGPFPECGGECPTDQVCTADTALNACACEPIVVPCAQSPYPECGGECPADRVCEPDASGLDTCGCVPIGQECSQCGPGPHFIDQCGPFPPVGTDLVANNGAVVGIDVDLDCVRDVNLVLHPCPAPDQLLHVEKTLGPIDDSVNFPGTSPVDGHPTGPGLDVIDTEIVSLCLTNGAVTLAAGVGGPSVLPLQPSLGAVAEDLTSPDPAVADSFFDVFFEVSGIAGGPVYNQTPLQVHSRIDCLPPAASYRHPVGICIPLTTRGVCDDSTPCVSDLDCLQGACAGTQTLANLVSANHSVNQPVCDLSPFPECGGDCPPDQECRPSVDGTDACRCEPIQPPACEQGPFPECGGECPTDQVCEPIAMADVCRCVPVVVPCEQGPFPECGGECPPDQVCTEDPTGVAACVCEPIPIPCEQGPYPECGGECPPDQVCEPIAGTTVCRCVPVIVPCEQGPFPECGGECPTDQVCTEDPTGVAACVCEAIVIDCEASPYPTCDGECPPDQICLRDPNNEACVCEPLVIPCEETPFPECDGECPPDLVCEPDPDGGNSCTCVPPPVPCDESSPPVCDGFCPNPQQDTCVNIPGTDVCDCRPCLVNVPGHNIDMRFVSRNRIEWIGVPCAFVYNVYRFAGPRLVDANSDGLADDYGSCFLPDLLVPSAVDTAVPPSGSLLAYLVTGESSAGEGSMGFASNLLQRPNNNPCP